MTNIRLKNYTWDAGNIYDSSLGKTQAEINAMTGKDGADGVSPAVTVTTITGGHRVNITDKTHPNGQDFYVYDGTDGEKGDKGDPAPTEDITAAVSSYLSENVVQDAGYVLDKTLTIEDAAADSKAVGNAVEFIQTSTPDASFNFFDYGNDWIANVRNSNVKKEKNKFTFLKNEWGAWKYFSLLSNQFYSSSDTAVKNVPADAYTLQNILEPYKSYEIVIKVCAESDIPGGYLGIYNKGANSLHYSTRTSSPLRAGCTYTLKYFNDLIPVALCMQLNNNVATDSYFTITVKEVLPNWIYAKEIETKIRAARWTKSNSVNPVTLLHCSDIHGDGRALSRIIAFSKAHSTVIQDVISTGDMSNASMSSDFTFWSNRDTSKILVALGNHDYNLNNQTDANGKHTKYSPLSAVVQKWIEPNVSEWGVVRPEGAAYYYKDYSYLDDYNRDYNSSNRNTNVRLIVLDCNLTDSEGGTAQKTWLEGVLADAKTNNKHVVIATHFVILENNNTYTRYVNNNFTRSNIAATKNSVYEFGNETSYVSTVQDFIDGGGKFVCWLSGHIHEDIVSYPTGYPNQLIVTICSASPNRSWATGFTVNDLERTPGTATEDAFNIVTINANQNCVSIVRVGANLNMYMKPRDTLCYNYSTHQFVN